MRSFKSLVSLIITTILFSCNNNPTTTSPPTIESHPKIYSYFGQEVIDEYANLENLEDTLVLNFMKAQTKYTHSFIREIEGRSKILDFEKACKEADKASSGYLRLTGSDTYFFLKKEPKEDLYKLYYKHGFEGEEVLLLDPMSINTNAVINYMKPSPDASKVVVNLTEDGAEIGTMYIIDVAKKEVMDNIAITHCWPSDLGGVVWLNDNNSFIYQHLPVIDTNSKDFILNTASVLYTIGDDPKKLNILFSRANNPELDITPADFPITLIRGRNENYLFGRIGGAQSYDDYYYTTEFSGTNISWKPLYKKEDKIDTFVLDKDENVFFITAKNASNFKIGKTHMSNPNFKDYETVVEEDIEYVISDIAITSEGLFFVKTKHGVSSKLFRLKDNAVSEIPIPKPSGDMYVSARGPKSEQLTLGIYGWLNDYERYEYDFETKTFEFKTMYPSSISKRLKDYEVKEIEVPSHDGTMVPLSIIHKKGIVLNSSNRLFIAGYGAYGWSYSPSLERHMHNWVHNGGVYAVAHVRGGGEKGDSWHKGGYKLTKPNTWKDFNACVEYLINKKYTSPDKVAAWSASAGGVLIGRAITERPDLYAAAIIEVGMLNALRSEFGYNGENNTKEFGTVKDSLGFIGLHAMDAYHHVKTGTSYPALYITGGIKDSRVPAWEPVKFAAKIQAATGSNNPVLLNINFEGGHGFDIPENEQDEALADVLTFALWQTGHPDFQIK
ncbi:prolyl oligopeptidase family serine peptidase [Flavobacteriaceae bacterium MHTCC 0001]